VTSAAKDCLALWQLSVPARCVLVDRSPGLELQLHLGDAIARTQACSDPAMAHALAERWWAEFAKERRAQPRFAIAQP
jgi:hypothetical protein